MRKLIILTLTFLILLSFSKTNEVHFESDANGYLVYNNDDSLSFDAKWNLLNSTVSLRDDISKASFKNDSLRNILLHSNIKIHTGWLGSLFNVYAIENIYEKEIQHLDSLGISVEYGRNPYYEELVTYLKFRS